MDPLLAQLLMEVVLLHLGVVDLVQPALLVLQLHVTVIIHCIRLVSIVIDVFVEHVLQRLLAQVHSEVLIYVVLLLRLERSLNVELFVEPVLPLFVAPVLHLCSELQIHILRVGKVHLSGVGLGGQASIIGLLELMLLYLLHHLRLLRSFDANVEANLSKLLGGCPVLL